jgi:ATP-binding cassette, subfamily B, bacterial IrtA/YbtP
MTAVQPVVGDVEPDSAEKSPAGEAQRGANFDALALQQLLAPARRAMAKAQRIQSVNTARVWTIVAVVIGAVLVRTIASGTALTITHFADVDLQRSLRRRIVDTLGRLPLGWFNNTSSGEVRKAVQNDVGELHFLVAHSAVENAGVAGSTDRRRRPSRRRPANG